MYPVSSYENVEKRYDFGNPTLRLGASIISDTGVVLAFSASKRFEEDQYILAFGIEYNLTNWFDIYAGMRDELFSAGASLLVLNMNVGYSIAIDRVDYGFNNLVSILMKF